MRILLFNKLYDIRPVTFSELSFDIVIKEDFNIDEIMKFINLETQTNQAENTIDIPMVSDTSDKVSYIAEKCKVRVLDQLDERYDKPFVRFDYFRITMSNQTITQEYTQRRSNLGLTY